MGCRKECYFLEFMNVDVASDFVGAFTMFFLVVPRAIITTATVCFEPPHSLNLDFQVFVFFKLFRGFD